MGPPDAVSFALESLALQGRAFVRGHVTAVPEPERWLLMIAGLVLVCGVARRKLLLRGLIA